VRLSHRLLGQRRGRERLYERQRLPAESLPERRRLHGRGQQRCEFEICGTITISARADVTTYARCVEATGDLNVQPNFADFTASDLPNLRTVRGKVTIAGFNDTAQRVTLQALQTVGGNIEIAGRTLGLKEIRFPSLTTIGPAGGRVAVNILGNMHTLEMPQLRTINGSFLISDHDLCTANFRRVERVTGDFSMLSDLAHVPYSSISALVTATQGTNGAGQIGCCTLVDKFMCESYDLNQCAETTCPP
jgi:hypothetical protein